MNNKLQNPYQKVKVLETSIFGYIFEQKEQKYLPVYLNGFIFAYSISSKKKKINKKNALKNVM